jgi:hypothetical protein
MQKNLILAVALVLTSAVSGFAAEPVKAKISSGDLSAMGLSGMTVVSDAQGKEVRGMGVSFTSGNGFALGLNPLAGFSQNSYNTGGNFLSNGQNASHAGKGFGLGLATPTFSFSAGLGHGQFGGGASNGLGF